MKKYILELREPLWRRYLRWTLWAIIGLGVAGVVATGALVCARWVNNYRLEHSSARLSAIDPQLGVYLAQELFSKNQNERILYIKAAITAKDWELADALLEPLRESPSLLSAAYDLQTLAVLSPSEVPAAAKALLDLNPQSDTERLAYGQAAALSQNSELIDRASRHLTKLMHSSMRYEATLARIHLSLAQGNIQEANERILSLIDRTMPAAESIELLSLLKQQELAEYNDYLGSLRLRMRNDIALSVGLIDFLWDKLSPSQLLRWFELLRPSISTQPEILVRKVAALKRTDDPTAKTVAEIDDPILQESISLLTQGRAPLYYKIKQPSHWTLLLRYAQLRDNAKMSAHIAEAMNQELGKSAWAAQLFLQAATQNKSTEQIAQAWDLLELALPQSKITQLSSAYWQLLTKKIDDIRAYYKSLRNIAPAYQTRSAVRCSMAFAYFTLGSSTDALMELSDTPSTTPEKFLRGYILGQAGQSQNAVNTLSSINPTDLSNTEAQLLEATLSKLQEDSPVVKFFEILQAPQPQSPSIPTDLQSAPDIIPSERMAQ